MAKQAQSGNRGGEPRAISPVHVLAKELKITDPKILDITYNDFKAQSPSNLEISRPGAENILAQFPGGSQKVEDYVDAGLLEKLRSDGHFTAMAQKYKR